LLRCATKATSQLPEVFAAGHGVHGWPDHAALARELLGDDPARNIDALKTAIRAGAAPADLSRSLAYVAALRVARFGNANEHADWETALTTVRGIVDGPRTTGSSWRRSRFGRCNDPFTTLRVSAVSGDYCNL
jgi:hypothetical protein